MLVAFLAGAAVFAAGGFFGAGVMSASQKALLNNYTDDK